MIHLKVDQQSAEWRIARYGIPTASNAGKIITAAKGDKSTQWDSFISQLIAERHAMQIFPEGTPNRVDSIEMMLNLKQTEAMIHGTETEPRAASAYSFLTGYELTEAGFMMNDNRTAGASLDRLIVGQKRGAEFKCAYSLNVHVNYCLSRNIEIDKRPQLQWQLWVSELEAIDICAFYPGTITVIVSVERDEEYIKKIEEYHPEFMERLEKRWTDWQAMQPQTPEEKQKILRK